jgi:uncharacterized protein YegL
MTILANYNHFLLIDKSGSMSERVGNKTRWQAAEEFTVGLIGTLAQLDKDGVDVITFGGGIKHYPNVADASTVSNIFKEQQPMGGTPTAEALTKALELANGDGGKPDLITIVTDGEPNDKEAVKKLIIQASNALEKDEDLTILFLQVGDNVQAREWLASLDDNLTEAKFDIVDAKNFSEAEALGSYVALLEQAIND